MYPTYLYAIDWEVIDFRYIISNINHMDFQPGPLPSSFRKFYATDTEKPKSLATMSTTSSLQEKRPERVKDPKFKMNPHLANGDSNTQKS